MMSLQAPIDEADRTATPVASDRSSSLTERLVDLLDRPVSEEVRRRAAVHVLDWIGCAAAGSVTETGAVFARHQTAAPRGAARTMSGAALPVADAAFADGALGTLLEMDDVYKTAVLHPGPVVVPAALAVAETRGIAGPSMLDAIVRGYEAMIRLGCCVGKGHYRYFHNTATCGPIGSAAAVADLIGLSRPQTVWALGNAMTQAGGLWQCRDEPVMTKALHTARAAQSGLVAAEMAETGLTGPRFILDGPLGFFAALAPDGTPERLLDEPDGPWRLTGVSIKPWPACRHTHAAIDAALLAREAIGGRPVARIVVRTYRDAVLICDRSQPVTTAEARFSLQHAVAVALGRPPRLDDFQPENLARKEIASLRRKIALVAEPTYDASYPSRFGSGITVTLTDGQIVVADAPDAWGDPENPVPDDEVVAKASALLGSAGFGASQTDDIVAAALSLADDGSATELRNCLVRRPAVTAFRDR